MKKIVHFVLFYFVFYSSFCFSYGAGVLNINDKQVKLITESVEDEIYDYGYYKMFSNVGNNVGSLNDFVVRVQIYVNPLYNLSDGYGEVIYNYMPFGEVYRLYYLDEKKGVVLDGNPQNNFPLSQPSHKTVFMESSEVYNMKSKWYKKYFFVHVNPSNEIINESIERQKKRVGFSDSEYKIKK